MKTLITISIDVEADPETVVDHIDFMDQLEGLCENFTSQDRAIQVVSVVDGPRYLAAANSGDGTSHKVFDTVEEAFEYGDDGSENSSQEIYEFEGELLSIEFSSYGQTIVNGNVECTIFSRTGTLINIDEREAQS